jgi:hypothetical protein
MKAKLGTMLLVAIVAAIVTGYSSPVSAQTMSASTSRWAGTWESKRDGVPSVILKVTQDGVSIQGQAEFNLLKGSLGAAPTIAGTMKVAMVNPHLQGDALAFQIVREDRSGDASKRAVLNFVLAPVGDGAARLHRSGGDEADLEVDMLRVD